MSMSAPADNTPDPYAPWRIPDFRRYAFSWFLMMFAKHVEFAAVSFHFVKLYDKNTAALAIGMMGLVQAIPVMLLAIPGGQLADRFDRRVLLILTIGITVLSSTGLLWVIILEAPVLWIYGCLVVGAIGRALGSPSRASLLPQLIPVKIFPKAITWNSTAFYIATVTGPLVGGALVAISDLRESLAGYLGTTIGVFMDVAFYNAAPAFALLVVCRLTAMGAVYLIRHRAPPRDDQPMSWESVAAGAKFVWRTKLILATITLDLFAVLLGGAIFLLPVYANDILNVGAWGFGLLRAADAVGAMCMAFWLAHHPLRKRAGIMMVFAIIVFGFCTIVFGVSTSFWLSMFALFVIGAMDNISVVVRHTLVQMLTPDEMRGRVSAINGIFIVASNDLGGLESGIVAGFFGPVISVVSGGIGTIVVVLGAIALWPQLLKIRSLDSIKPVPLQETDRETEL